MNWAPSASRVLWTLYRMRACSAWGSEVRDSSTHRFFFGAHTLRVTHSGVVVWWRVNLLAYGFSRARNICGEIFNCPAVRGCVLHAMCATSQIPASPHHLYFAVLGPA